MEHLAETMTDFLLRRKYITEEQTEWCHYMLIKNIMSIASLVLLLPLGALIVGWGGTLFYTFVFRFLRARTGGYHAKTPHGCLLGSVCCQSVMLFLSAHSPTRLFPRLSRDFPACQSHCSALPITRNCT